MNKKVNIYSFNDECYVYLGDYNKLKYLNQKRIDKVKEKIFEINYDLDFEPWSVYKVNGEILFELVQILEDED